MLIDQTQRKWAWISFLIFLAATGTYAVYAATAPNGPHGGSVMGLIYGIVGTAVHGLRRDCSPPANASRIGGWAAPSSGCGATSGWAR